MIIYKITNLSNGRFYIGRTTGSLKKRWQRHCSEAVKNIHPGIAFHAAIRKYTPSYFTVEILCNAEDVEQLSRLEAEKIKQARREGHLLYNLTDGGDGSAGFKHSLASKKKLSAKGIQRRGDSATRVRPYVINGIKYPSVTEAARQLRACRASITRWASGSPFRLKSERSDYTGNSVFRSRANPALSRPESSVAIVN